MRILDASSIVHGWDNYPIEQFPKFWDWIENLIENLELAIPSVAMDEVSTVSPDCYDWLRDKDISKVQPSNDILRKAISIKQLLGIGSDNFHPRGVGGNDITIIATAWSEGSPLISNESIQTTRPVDKCKYKIPLVCGLPELRVECTDLITFIKSSQAIFN